MRVIKVGPGQTLSEALAENGFGPDFLADNTGNVEACDCPPGICLEEAEFETFEGPTAEFFRALMDGPADDEFDDDDDFDVEDEGLTREDRIEAVAQLGRITETLAAVTNLHGQLVRDLLDSES